MQKNILYGLVLFLIMQGSVLAMSGVPVFGGDDEQVDQPSFFRPNNPLQANSRRVPLKAALKKVEESLSDFEEAFDFLQQNLGDAKKTAHDFGKRLWAKPLTECLRFYAQMYRAVTLIVGTSGIAAGMAVVFYIGPSFAYKFISLTWQFADVLRSFMEPSGAGEQCFAQLANGNLVLVACNQLKNMGIDPMKPELIQQALKQAVAHQAVSRGWFF